jgi:hypothetical protein
VPQLLQLGLVLLFRSSITASACGLATRFLGGCPTQ